jgi:hypothetical protein
MYTLNQKASEGIAVLATVDPVSQAAGTVTTGWVDASVFFFLLALIDVGVFGSSATVDAKLQQATDSSGTGAKDITGKAITQLLAAGGNNRQALINVRGQELDVEGGFRYVRLSITVGTAATLIQAALLGCVPRFEAASAYNQAGVAQIV